MCLSLEDVALPIYVLQNDFKLNGILGVDNLLEMVFFVKYTMPYFKEYGFICREII